MWRPECVPFHHSAIAQPTAARTATTSYARHVKRISQRELRNESAAVMDAVERGEAFVISRRGVDVAELRPVPSKAFDNTLEVKRAFERLPKVDYTTLRKEADALFGPDRLGD